MGAKHRNTAIVKQDKDKDKQSLDEDKQSLDEDKQSLDKYMKDFVLVVHNNRVRCGPYIPGKKLVTFKISYKSGHEVRGTEVDGT